MKRKGISLLAVVLLLALLAGCGKSETNRIEENLFAFDTYMTLAVSEGPNSRAGLDAAVRRIHEIEQRMSATLPESDVSRINDSAGKQPVQVHSDTFFVISKALEYAKMTNGGFDISMLPISRLWDLSGENPRIPDEEDILSTLALVDYKKIKLDEEDRTVYLESEGMAVDLGGIAKGYAGDEVVRILKEHGVAHALVNLGGNIMVVNGREDGSAWRIGIQNPRQEEDSDNIKAVAVVQAKDCAIVTSGDYERYNVKVFEQTGQRYHHIFDPETGYPADKGLISVTIVTESGINADALSTSLFVLEVEDGLKLANRLQGVDAMLITKDKEVYFSDGFQERVSGIHPDYRVAGD
ncbi:MAG: FAD:protein FMN transferase [Caldicoprobacterales bacterium]|jgi:thiamine biosynthesis lipoprotein|nr:FAD:protein FMN transferase [Clostridiales bacterium]